MGMYTELVMACKLKKDAPEDVVETLKYMVGDSEYPAVIPTHDLFKTDRWKFMLRCDSYYFDGDTNSTFRYDDIRKSYVLTIRCNLKNYCDEIEEFLNWIIPYSNTNGFVGYSRYEESETPTLIYFNEGKVELT